MILNNSSLFMSTSNLILIDIHFMKVKRTHVNLFFSNPCWWIRKKSEIVIRWRYLLRKVRDNY
jgi:hypothetical protein